MLSAVQSTSHQISRLQENQRFLGLGNSCVSVKQQLQATQADRFGLEKLRPASDSLELPPGGILESARRSSGEAGIMVGKTLSYVLSLRSWFSKTEKAVQELLDL